MFVYKKYKANTYLDYFAIKKLDFFNNKIISEGNDKNIQCSMYAVENELIHYK